MLAKAIGGPRLAGGRKSRQKHHNDRIHTSGNSKRGEAGVFGRKKSRKNDSKEIDR